MDASPPVPAGSWASPDFARDYERGFGSVVAPVVAAGLLQAAHLQPGDVVLECACGTGACTTLLAQAVGTGGVVVACDLSAAMLAIAAEKLRPATSSSVRYALMDMRSLGCISAAFDRVVSNLGMHIVPDRQAALAQFRSVLRPGGRLAFSVPGDWSVEPFWTYFWERVAAPDAVTALTTPPRQWAAEDRLVSLQADVQIWKQAAETAGFRDVDVHQAQDVVWFPSAERFLQVSAFGHVSRTRGMINDDGIRDRVFGDIRDRLQGHQTPRGVPMDISVLCVTATVS